MTSLRLPSDHPRRLALADEVHARPPSPIRAPAVASSLALMGAAPEESYACLRALASLAGIEIAASAQAHAIVELPELRVSWERHGEFVRFTFIQALPGVQLAALDVFPTAFDALPPDWLAQLPGQTIAAADVLLLAESDQSSDTAPGAQWFAADALAGATVLDGAARVFTDFVLRDDAGDARRTRWLALDRGMGDAQSARLVQRLSEIEIYRMLALLALPLAREVLPELDDIERRLAEITTATAAMRGEVNIIDSQREERRLLDDLTQLASEVERSVAGTAFRFAAGQAYWEIVRARVAEFRERRVGDMRTIGGFLARRLAPAMHSAEAAARRQDELSERIERASTLLRTRVDVALEEQNQKLLEAMNRRSRTSLRIQLAVEGLSVAAITYYAVSLVNYIVRPLGPVWHGHGNDWIVAASVPVVALAAWWALSRALRGFHE